MPPSLTALDPAELTWRGAVDRALEPLHRAVAHDLRTPLNALGLNLALVRRTLERDTDSAKKWLGVVEDECRRLESLLDAHLKLGAPLPDSQEPKTVDLATLLGSNEPLLRCLAERRGVELEIEVSSAKGTWQEARLCRALMAVLSLLLAAPVEECHDSLDDKRLLPPEEDLPKDSPTSTAQADACALTGPADPPGAGVAEASSNDESQDDSAGDDDDDDELGKLGDCYLRVVCGENDGPAGVLLECASLPEPEELIPLLAPVGGRAEQQGEGRILITFSTGKEAA